MKTDVPITKYQQVVFLNFLLCKNTFLVSHGAKLINKANKLTSQFIDLFVIY